MSFIKVNDRAILRTTEILAIEIDDRQAWIRVKDQPPDSACISVGGEWGDTPLSRANALASAIGIKEIK